MIHAHKRYNAFEELFVALHRTLPVGLILIIYSPGCAGELFLVLSLLLWEMPLRNPVPPVRAETCPGICVLITAISFLPAALAPTTPHHPSTSTKSLTGEIPIDVPREKEKDAATLAIIGFAPPRPRRVPGRAELVARLSLGWVQNF